MSGDSRLQRIKAPVVWLYHESGIASLYGTGRNAWFVIWARTCRMLAFGGTSLVFALFFAELEFSDFQIGLFMTLTLAGDVALSFLLTMMADGLGRRRILFAGGLLMALSGVVFAYFENFWILLLAAVIGVVSATGGDFGPFRAIEESILSHLTNPKTRAYVLSWYVTSSALGSATGSAMAGRFVDTLKARDGWTDLQAYHATFWVYVIMGVANMGLAIAMTDKCEARDALPETEAATESAQGLLDAAGQDDDDDDDDAEDKADQPRAAPEAPKKKKSRFSQISRESRSFMYKLCFLLTVDSLAEGMVAYALTNYYMDLKFHLSKSTLGDIVSTNFILGAVATLFSGPLSRHLGLVNTMVFTHIPSSAAVLFFPLPQGVVLSVILLFIRGGLNTMDQAPRTAFIAGVVKPDERTAIMGITTMSRTLASTLGPTFTGALAQTDKFWIAFVIAGTLRLCYDFGLWAMFVNTKLYAHEETDVDARDPRKSVDEEAMEMRPMERET